MCRKERTEQTEGGGVETYLSTMVLSCFSTVNLTDLYFHNKCHERFN